ncbi:hypothetical protein PV518_33755, partial [Streptomyces sp. ND04-05B]|nr:hypothetical protein [Streptomyces sp. ND04-05B]
MAVGGNFTNCNCGPDVPACESPTQPVATVGLCLTDGTPIAVTVVRDCAGTITSEGWINLLTGLFTPGPAPADAGACDAGCVDTLCRQRCDDTDGDGQPDATYSELWCIRADGTAELVLTYQDDPSTPYTPVSPVDCTYGCAETETLTLCDDSGPFLRRYTWVQDVATFQDYALDGSTPHVVTGTVGACSGSGATPCAEQTTPAATLGLCLADGTPIAVVITRDCATDTVTQDGWLNLTTGAYSAGAPPAGAMACGDSRAFELAGLLCDVLPDGTVAGLVLVEYEYNPDGSLNSVRLVDPATGGTYTLQGELRQCPGDTEQPDLDLTVLCDIAADGTATAFVRDYRRDTNGQITGHTDYTLDGQPYTPAGTVGQCAEPCRDTSTLLLCDQPPTTQTEPVPLATLPPGPASGSLPNDVTYTVDNGTWFNADQGYIILDGETQTWTFSRPVTVEFAIGGLSGLDECAELPAGVVLVTLDPNHTYDPATRLLCPITGNNPAKSTFRTTSDVTSLTWKAVGRPTLGRGVVSMDVTASTPPEQFLRHITTDCDGNTVAVTDTTLDGAPYTVTGEVGQCTAAGGGACCPTEPCRNTNSLLLCDLPTDGTPTPTVTDTAPGTYYPYPSGVATAGAQALWDGGTLNLPAANAPQPGTTGTVRTAAATVQAARPVCDAGTAHVTVQMDASQLGPDNGCAATGFLGLYNGIGEANRIALALTPANTPAGWSGTLTVEADVPAADLAAGNIAVAWAFDAYDDSGSVCPGVRRTAWQLSEFTTTVVYDQTGCATQFLRNVTVDCESGAVTAVTDTTLDGAPYTVTGEPGQCTA